MKLCTVASTTRKCRIRSLDIYKERKQIVTAINGDTINLELKALGVVGMRHDCSVEVKNKVPPRIKIFYSL